jgi:hypothetical protein
MKKHIDMPPQQVVREIGKEIPNVWEQVKIFRAGKGKDLPDWPDWCYVPMAVSVAIATHGNDSLLPQASLARLNPAVITAAAAWRITQGIYRFDADLYNTLTSQTLDGNLPCDVLKRLPEWCVYIETIPDKETAKAGKPYIVGFWCHLEKDQNDGREELRFVFFWNNGNLTQLPIHLGDWSLDKGIKKFLKEAKKQASRVGKTISAKPDGMPNPSPYIQLVLYLCADNADLPAVPQHPKTRVRQSGQADVARRPRVWDVGLRIGSSIRRYRNQQVGGTGHAGTHESPRPHVRKAHWHHYWTGPKDGEHKLILHWLPPIPVNTDQEGDGPAVVHKIKKL